MEIAQIKVSQFGEVKNQFKIRVKTESASQCGFDTVFFQSYDSIIVKQDFKGQIWLDENYWDYSRTTGKYRNLFLGENKKETLKKIKDGTYKLANLNE